ncbi:hemolysin family protein [Ornithinimicrobium faecis]|uniref:Hemolysin family protein n=1 Tax=Ornithinimicrobium faecis TaxID=2934158 RepID=A0ABY4YSE8_9MICO|nr:MULTISPECIES: hemolysin family protein [unclassified Ornithinimicrobium]USQ79521.1 hemolysin family protein [Ornithinimicrobium sp. HY1793]
MLIVSGLLVIFVLTVLTGYFVAQEFAYVSVDRGQLQKLADEGDPAAARALKVTSRLSFTLSGAQFGITLTALLVGFAGEPLLGRGLANVMGFTDLSPAATTSLSLAITLVFATGIQMVIGELGPKNLAIARPVPLARALSRSTLIYLAVAGPIIGLFDRASNALLRSVGIEPLEELPQGATPEELHRIIDEAHTGGLLDEDLSRLLGRGLAFRNHVAQEVMTPRIDVETVQADEPAARVLELLETGHSRFPVIGRDIDDIVGVIGLHELLAVPAAQRPTATVRDLASDALIIPESLPLPRVLEQMRESHRQIAVVVDEYGGFAGIITFEDVAEEVVGEIWDEGDTEEESVEEQPDGTWEVPARLRLDEVLDTTGVALPEHEDYDTVSGLIMERLERVAEEGDTIEVAWDARDEHGSPEVHRVRLDVLSVQRFVPDMVRVHAPTTHPGSLADEEVRAVEEVAS